MELLKVIKERASGKIEHVWFNTAHIVYATHVKWQNPTTQKLHENCLLLRTKEDDAYYIDLDLPVEKKDIAELHVSNPAEDVVTFKKKKKRHEGSSYIAGS